MMLGSCRRATGWLFCWLLAGFAAFSAPALAADLFTVTGVPVDATADSSANARVHALAEGQRLAYRQLLQRLTLRSDWARLPNVDEAGLNDLVLGIEIADERTSSTRYIAKLSVSFNRDGVRALLRKNDIPFSETMARPALVLPVYQSAAGLVLWGDDNPWRDAWADVSTRDSLVLLLAPLGDIEDVNAITAEQAVAGDADRLGALARRYNAADVLVAQATAQADRLAVAVTRYGSTGPQAVVESFPGQVGPQLIRSAVTAITTRLEEDWKRQTLLRFGEQASLSANVPFRDLPEWLKIRQKLTAAAEVQQLDVISLTRHDAQVVIHYLGNPQRLMTALAQRDLALLDQQGFWSLRLTGSGAVAAPAPAGPPAKASGGGPQTAPATQ